MALGAGDVLEGRYRLDARLGAGGFGTVWRAHDLRMKRKVAVKTGLPDTPDEVRRFVREAELAGGLSHPNIATVHDFGQVEWDGRELVYLVMELVPGDDIGRIAASGTPPFAETVGWARQICAALAAAHDAGIVHRDIKPANVVVAPGGAVKVLDFGIAKHQVSGTVLTAENTVIGSLPYMAPERWRGGPVDGRSDLYALGCLLMELWTGRLPFTGTELYELMGQHAGAQPPVPSAFAPGLPPDADRLVLDLLAKDPGHRPPHAREVARRLELLALTAAAPTVTATAVAPELAGPGRPAVPARPAHAPTVLDPGADRAGADRAGADRAGSDLAGAGQTGAGQVGSGQVGTDPIRAVLRRRLDQIQALPPDSDLTEFVELLDALVPEAQRELGPDDPLTTDAVLSRARRVWDRDPADPVLARTLPKLVRVFGAEDRRTVETRAALLGHAARLGPDDPRAVLPELRQVIEQATRVLGPYDPVTLRARLALAMGKCRRFVEGREIPIASDPAIGQCTLRRGLVEPLLPDLARGLAEDDPARWEALRTVARDAYLLRDYVAAARLYDELVPVHRAVTGGELDPKAALYHARSVGDSGDPARAVALLDELKPRVWGIAGPTDPLADEVHRLRGRYHRKARRLPGATGSPGKSRSWFRRG